MFNLSEAQTCKLDMLEGRYPSTFFTVLQLFSDGAVLVEHEDLESCGTFVLALDGRITADAAAA